MQCYLFFTLFDDITHVIISLGFYSLRNLMLLVEYRQLRQNKLESMPTI